MKDRRLFGTEGCLVEGSELVSDALAAGVLYNLMHKIIEQPNLVIACHFFALADHV